MKDKFVNIKGTNIMRDVTNMSLINTDKNELEEYLNRRNYLMQQKNEINTMKEDINTMKSELSDIKDLLIKIAGNK